MTTFNTAGLKALFTFPFRQTNWQSKLLVLALLVVAGYIVPVIPWLFVAGYIAEIMRRQALEGGEPELPEWEDWGRLAMDGFRLSVTGLVINLPVMIVYFLGFGLYFISILPMAITESESDLFIGFMLVSMTIMMVCMFGGMLLQFVIGVVSPALLTHVAVKRSFAAILEAREWWKVLRANLGGYVIALAIVFMVYYVLFMAGYMMVMTFVCCAVGMVVFFVMYPYLAVIAGVVFGQVYREGQLKRAEATGAELESAVDAESAAGE